MTLRRLSILQWFGFFAGGLTWFAAHVVGYSVTVAECSVGGPHWSIDTDVWEGALFAASALLVTCAGLAALRVVRATQQTSYESDPPPGRIRFFAIAALVANVAFLVVVGLDALGVLLNVACRQG